MSRIKSLLLWLPVIIAAVCAGLYLHYLNLLDEDKRLIQFYYNESAISRAIITESYRRFDLDNDGTYDSSFDPEEIKDWIKSHSANSVKNSEQRYKTFVKQE